MVIVPVMDYTSTLWNSVVHNLGVATHQWVATAVPCLSSVSSSWKVPGVYHRQALSSWKSFEFSTLWGRRPNTNPELSRSWGQSPRLTYVSALLPSDTGRLLCVSGADTRSVTHVRNWIFYAGIWKTLGGAAGTRVAPSRCTANWDGIMQHRQTPVTPRNL